MRLGKRLGLGLGSALGSGGGVPRFQVATRAANLNTRVAQSGSLSGKQVQQTATFDIFQNTNNLVFKWANYSSNSAPSLIDAGEYSFTIKAAVKYGGVTYPINFPSGRVETLVPDALVASLPLNLAITAGTKIELRWFIEFATAPVNWPVATRYNTDRYNQFGNALVDEVDGVGNIGFARQTNFLVLPPYQIIGDYPLKTSFEIMGDSISSSGDNDTFAYNTGWVPRALTAAQIPFTNNGGSGNSLAAQIESWGSTAAQQARRQVTRTAVSHVLCGLCTNDFSNGRTDAQILANLATLKTQLDAINVKLIPITCYPRTNAANNAKVASDSVNVWTYRRNFNAAIRTNNGVGYGYFDAALYTQASGNIDLWRTDLGTPTSDGIHPSGVVHRGLESQFVTWLSTNL